MRKKTIVKGAAILMIANLITRIMGFYYRTCMVKIIGAEGMGLYQLIMPIYMLTWSITSSGLTTTVSKLTAAETAKREFGNAKRFLHIALFISLFVSLSLSVIIYFFSTPIAEYIIKDSRTAIPLQILSLALPFMALGSCARGYFMGMQKQIHPALSQIIEQLVRIAVILNLSSFFVYKGLDFACAIAVWGIVLGEAISFLYTALCLKYVSSKTISKKPSFTKRKALTVLCSMAVPLTMARVTGSFLATAENILIPQRLALFPCSENALATFGSLTGMAMPLIQFPSAVLMAVSTTLVPALSETEALGSQRETSMLIEKTLCCTAIIGCGVAAMFAAFPREICNVIYSNPSLGEMLLKLCLICPFLYLNITITGILNGLGCHGFIFKQNVISSAINIFFIYFMIPQFGIDAFIAGTILSLMVIVALGIHEISKKSHLSLSFYNSFFTPVVCAASAYIAVKLLPTNDEPLTFIISATFLGIIYLFLLLLSGAVSIKDLFFFMPKK